MPSDEKLLEEIRENFDYSFDYWRDIRDDAAKDMRYIAGDPWEPAERTAREDPDSKRPCLTFQELTQYTKQVVNSARLNPISVKVSPNGNGASEKTAELRQGIIRQVEYQSKAQAAYITALQGAVERSYGYFAVSTEYEEQSGSKAEWTPQTIKIRRIPNPDSVLLDPDFKEADSSDKTFAFIVDSMRKATFEKKYPNAEFKTFTQEQIALAPRWIQGDNIQVAEYWKLETEERTLMLMDDQGTAAYLDEYDGGKIKDSKEGCFLVHEGQEIPIKDYRKCEEHSVCQYITNGVEILETNEWPGRWIPIVPVFGEELFVDMGKGVERKLLSLIRPARDPFMMYCWLRSNQAEEGSMTPKVPYTGYEGQFDTQTDWASIHRKPTAYAEVKATTEATGQTVLPLPARLPFIPNFEAYEAVCESTKRAIQSAIGMFNTSVGKHDTNAESGKAIQALDQQSSEGSFHFIDNYKRALEFAGRIYDDLLPQIYGSQRQVGIRTSAGKHSLAAINQPNNPDSYISHPDSGDSYGSHLVTISTGPSFESQRQEAKDFLETLAKTQFAPKIMDQVVKALNLGEFGDEIARRLVPPEFAQQGSQEQTQQQLAQMTQQHQVLTEQLHKAMDVINTKQVEAQSKEKIAAMEQETKISLEKLQIEAKIAVAEITTKAQVAQTRATIEADIYKQLHSDAHEAGLQAADQSHEKDLQASDQAAAAQSQESQQGHEADQATQAQEAAANQPEPTAAQ